MNAVLVLGLINLLIEWLNSQPVETGGVTQKQLDATDAKWQETKTKWRTSA
jgi:hypothetical protein